MATLAKDFNHHLMLQHIEMVLMMNFGIFFAE